MGQYGNQPDFGTRAINIVPTGDPITGTPGQHLNSAALYIGTGGTLACRVVGGNSNEYTYGEVTIFGNIPDGTFFPVIVDNVWAELDGSAGTTCSNIVALY